MEIGPSARKHGVPDADIEHVVDNPLAVFAITGSSGDEAEMYVGFNQGATTVLDVLVIRGELDEPLAIHADTARASTCGGCHDCPRHRTRPDRRPARGRSRGRLCR